MTTHIPAARYTDHTVTGTPVQLANLLANHTAAGTLVAATAPRPAAAGTCRIILRLRDTTPPTSRPRTIRVNRPNRRTGRIVALAATAVGVIAGVLAAVAYLLGQLIEFITAHAATVAAVALALGVVVALAGRTSNRRHCPGC